MVVNCQSRDWLSPTLYNYTKPLYASHTTSPPFVQKCIRTQGPNVAGSYMEAIWKHQETGKLVIGRILDHITPEGEYCFCFKGDFRNYEYWEMYRRFNREYFAFKKDQYFPFDFWANYDSTFL